MEIIDLLPLFYHWNPLFYPVAIPPNFTADFHWIPLVIYEAFIQGKEIFNRNERKPSFVKKNTMKK